VSWRPILGAGALGLLIGQDSVPPTLVVAAVAAGMAFVLDDDAAVLLGSCPTSLARRRSHRLALTLPLAAVTWSGVYVGWSWRVGSGVGAWPATLAFAAMVALVLGTAAVASGRGGVGRGGVAAAPVLLAVIVSGTVVPSRLGLFVGPRHETGWTAVLVVSLLALLVASRDPAIRHQRLAGR
jgi:hypothetical protein